MTASAPSQRPDPASETQARQQGWRSRVRLLPLVLLVIAAVVLASVGLVTKMRLSGSVLEQLEGRQIEPSACGSDRRDSLAGDRQPWGAENRAASEEIWANTPAANEQAVEGEDGWYFLGDAYVDNVSQMVGRKTPTAGEIDQFTQRYTKLENELAAEGIEMAIMIAPAKWDVYRDKTPLWSRDLVGATTADLLQAATPDLNWIDPRDKLRDAPHPTYSPVNSHWTDYGGYVAWDHAAACLASIDDRFSEVGTPKLSGVERTGDAEHNEFALYGKSGSDDGWTVPKLEKPLPAVTLTDRAGKESEVPGEYFADMLDFPLHLESESPQSDLHLLIVGDSMSSALTPYATYAFSSVSMMRHAAGEAEFPDILQEAKNADADLVIIEFTERNLAASMK